MDAPAVIDALEKALAEGDLPKARTCMADLKRGGSSAAMQLAAEVLHELRQPLLGVKAYAQMLRDDGSTKIPASLVLAQVDRMEHIIADFTRLASDKVAPQSKINLAHHARETGKLFALNTDPARLQVELDLVNTVEIQGNGRLVEQLMLNLLNNARDAMSGLGRVKLVVTREGAKPVVYVADWGPGIPAEMREKVFEPYVTSKGRGSGLGLAVCRRIAQEHGAAIGLAPASSLSDQPPPATVFRVVFPAGEAPAAAVSARKRLLVVDDEAIIRAVFVELMGRECEVVEAETAEEAIGHLRHGTFDLVVSDKNLPGQSGLDVAIEARRLSAGSRVILMTGYPSLVTAQQALELGVMDYLLKPFDDIKVVREKIRSALSTPAPVKHQATSKRVDVFEDNPAGAQSISEALSLLGLVPRILQEAPRGSDEPPAAVVVSWDFAPAHGSKAVELARAAARGAPFVVLAENLTMEGTLESLRGGAVACLPKLLSDVRALSRELARALKLPLPP
ncbi:MAG: hybrid histidine protein kinase/response regulator SinK [Myxococcaceae bacterium]